MLSAPDDLLCVRVTVSCVLCVCVSVNKYVSGFYVTGAEGGQDEWRDMNLSEELSLSSTPFRALRLRFRAKEAI